MILVRDELKGAYYETVDEVKRVLNGSGRNSLPEGTVCAAANFDGHTVSRVIDDMVRSGELTRYDDGKISLNESQGITLFGKPV